MTLKLPKLDYKLKKLVVYKCNINWIINLKKNKN